MCASTIAMGGAWASKLFFTMSIIAMGAVAAMRTKARRFTSPSYVSSQCECEICKALFHNHRGISIGTSMWLILSAHRTRAIYLIITSDSFYLHFTQFKRIGSGTYVKGDIAVVLPAAIYAFNSRRISLVFPYCVSTFCDFNVVQRQPRNAYFGFGVRRDCYFHLKRAIGAAPINRYQTHHGIE